MTATGHALVGTIIAARFQNPVVAIGLSFISHFACDILPHWDSGTNFKKKSHQRLVTETIIDVLISILLSFINFLLTIIPVFCILSENFASFQKENFRSEVQITSIKNGHVGFDFHFYVHQHRRLY